MKRALIRFGGLIGAMVLGLAAISSCATGSGGSAAPQPTNRMARLARVELDTLEIGYQAYQSHCTRCHSDRVPKPVHGRAWHPESMGLSLYQSLSAQQRYGVVEYLNAVEKSRFKVEFGALQDTE